MNIFLWRTGLLWSWLALLPASFAGEEPAKVNRDKGRYTLLNPTPPDLLRDFSTDRPDKTESAYTVDAGHFQVEADLLNYSYDRHNADYANTRLDGFSFASLNLKAGLLNDLDAQLVLPTFNYTSLEDQLTGAVQKNSGFGDITIRTKYNLWGNDGGSSAFAVMPFAKMPTAQDGLGNEAFEGGIIFPLAVNLPREWGMGLMTEIDLRENAVGSGHHVEWVNSITFSHAIASRLDGYVEFFSSVSAESSSDWIGTVDCGAVYSLTENINLDGGLNIGITRAADDLNPFLGISMRF